MCTCVLSIKSCLTYVYNGRDARIEEFPFYVYIQSKGQGGGCVLNRRWILTAAHVVDTRDPANTLVTVSMGIRGHGEIHRADKVIAHPAYNGNTMENDIALIRLKEKLVYSPTVQRVRLPPKDGRYDHSDRAIVIGMGKTATGRISDVLQAAEIPTLASSQCPRAAGDGGYTYNKDLMICAVDYLAQRDSAAGDSGGPLVVRDTSNTTFVIGVVSYGPAHYGRITLPAYYTRISRYVEWIKRIVSNTKI